MGRQGAHEMEDFLSALLVPEAGLAVSGHDALAGPLPDLAAQVGFVALAHAALCAERLQPPKSECNMQVSFDIQGGAILAGRGGCNGNETELLLGERCI